jgi:hypothetical protein
MWFEGGKRQFDFKFCGLGAWAEWACSGSRLLDFEARSNLEPTRTGELFALEHFGILYATISTIEVLGSSSCFSSEYIYGRMEKISSVSMSKLEISSIS